MSLPPVLGAALAAAVGSTAVSAARVGGGSINHAVHVHLADGREIFVKHHPDAPEGSFAAEAAGLAWLAEAGAVRTPAVLGVGEGPEARFLALEWIRPARSDAQLGGRSSPDWTSPGERLGRDLAALHRFGAPSFGLDHDNVIGPLRQQNAPCDTWAEFYGARRLVPMAREAARRGRLSTGAASRVEALAARLDDLCGPPEPPARLHGDLWGGNAILDAEGGPVVVDPAVYGGHREMDLAMMRLFGGFPAQVSAAYAELHPLAEGHEDRVGLCQLYPLLVHAALFGGSYSGSAERTARRYAGRGAA